MRHTAYIGTTKFYLAVPLADSAVAQLTYRAHCDRIVASISDSGRASVCRYAVVVFLTNLRLAA